MFPGIGLADPKAAAKALFGVLRLFGIDPEQIGKDKLAGKLTRRQANVVKRLDKDKVTPADFSDSDAEKRFVIRAAIYLLCKEVVISTTGRKEASNFAADGWRDIIDDPIVAEVTPQVTATMGTAALVALAAAGVQKQTDLLIEQLVP
jgi:hypothetical protein